MFITSMLLHTPLSAQRLLKRTVVASDGNDCKFDGYEGFMLGRYHREAQFFLVDCVFSNKIADKPIYRVPTNNVINWGERIYYYNCHRSEGNDFAWYANNFPADVKAIDTSANWLLKKNWNPLLN